MQFKKFFFEFWFDLHFRILAPPGYSCNFFSTRNWLEIFGPKLRPKLTLKFRHLVLRLYVSHFHKMSSKSVGVHSLFRAWAVKQTDQNFFHCLHSVYSTDSLKVHSNMQEYGKDTLRKRLLRRYPIEWYPNWFFVVLAHLFSPIVTRIVGCCVGMRIQFQSILSPARQRRDRNNQ